MFCLFAKLIEIQCLAALYREVFEEVGIIVLHAILVFKRVDPTGGNVAWCYLIDDWRGEPSQQEEGIAVAWQEPMRLLQEDCVFREYNRALFQKMEIIP